MLSDRLNNDVMQVILISQPVHLCDDHAGVLIFCIAFGITIGMMGERSRVMCEFFSELNEIVMRIVCIVMWSVLLRHVWSVSVVKWSMLVLSSCQVDETVGHGSWVKWVKWVNECKWVTWCKTLDP